MRKPARNKAPAKQDILASTSLPAPYKGLNARDPEALMPEQYSLSSINCFPTAADVELRAGASYYATGLPSHIKALHSYSPRSGPGKLFAVTDQGIFDASNLGAVGATVSAHTNGQTQAINFGTTGNAFLVVVNGTEDLRTYNGTTWASTPTLNLTVGGTPVATNQFSYVAAFKRRLFFARRDSAEAYSLPVDSVAGTIDLIPLGAQFTKGGYLHSIATWTIDGGTGIDDKIIFLSSKGQAAVYAGTDPTDPDAWALVGTYDLAEPVGKDPFIKMGGDVLYLSRSGLFPFSQALQSTTVANAVSDTIKEEFVSLTKRYGGNAGWAMALDPQNSLLVINVPITVLGLSKQLVMNTTTKAWTTFQGWNAYSFIYHSGQLFMGMHQKTAKAFSGLNDFGNAIVGTCKQAFTYLGRRGQNKKIKLIRPVLKLQGACAVEMAVDVDFRNDATFGPTNFTSGAGAVWASAGDSNPAVWDEDTWVDNSAVRLQWLSVAAQAGYAISVRLRFTSNRAKVAWTATDLLFEEGGFL